MTASGHDAGDASDASSVDEKHDASPRTILFTAFEPSGDALAAALIRALKAGDPSLRIVAMGGEAMEEAGAELLERTTDKAAMLLSGATLAHEHWRRMQRLKHWLATHRIAVYVPTDSSAAHLPLCGMMRRVAPHTRIAYLAAPQLWAWKPWRVHKLRRVCDALMCLMPFEVDWFQQRGVNAHFVSHPIFDDASQYGIRQHAIKATLPRADGLKLALLPGSREQEVRGNVEAMVFAVEEVRKRIEAADGRRVTFAIHARNAATRAWIEEEAADFQDPTNNAQHPEHINVFDGSLTELAAWADAAIAVSGTVTLNLVKADLPFVVMYRASPMLWWLIGQRVVRTPSMALPNLAAHGLDVARGDHSQRICTELMPYFGDVDQLASAAQVVLTDDVLRQRYRAGMAEVRARFERVRFTEAAGRIVREQLSIATASSSR